jgi:adenine-specific DNA-methyltransferase
MWNSRKSKQNDAKISLSHNHVLIYAKNMSSLRLNRMAADEDKFENPDNDPRGPWVADPFDAPQVRVNLEYPIVNPNTGQEYLPPKGRHWRTTKDEYERLLKDGMIVFGKTGKSKPQQKRFLTLAADKGVVPGTWWDDCGTATEATKEIQALYDNELTFDTPKPERLLQRIVHLATNSGDLVLDSFGGSGTTGAVAHKMGRKWIMVELGDHCHTHIAPRLQKVIDCEQGGISKAVEWKGGGGFRYYNLAPSMLEKDRWGNWIISKEFNATMLSEALCKIMGFKYAPSDEHYWIHGASTETDFIYVTTQTMDQAQLATISQEVGDNRSLLICCGAFRVKADEFPNLTLKKIPRTVLNKCEWGKDDYSLNVQNLPMAKEEPEEKTTKKSKPATTMPLFEEAGE